MRHYRHKGVPGGYDADGEFSANFKCPRATAQAARTSATGQGADVVCIGPILQSTKMKTTKAGFIVLMSACLVIGCHSTQQTQTESWRASLEAAGFKSYHAENPKQVRWISSLPQTRITPVQSCGKMFYTYPDRQRCAVYVGGEQDYIQYRNCRTEVQRPQHLNQPEFYNAALWGPWVW